MKEIPLTQGHVALVDDDDFEWLSTWKWCIAKTTSTIYAKRTLKGILMHREIFRYHRFDFTYVDHINHDGLDNRKANLRAATPHDNLGNQRKTRGNSRFKGVHRESQTGRWRASISVSGKLIKSPRMAREEDAAAWYNERAKAHFGEFALLNVLT